MNRMRSAFPSGSSAAIRRDQEEESQSPSDFIAYSAKRIQLIGLRCLCRIIKSPMNGFGTREDRALLFRSVTNGDDVVEFLIQELLHIFRCLASDINSDFFHHFNVRGCTPFGLVPALTTSNRSFAALRNSPSAIWLRAELPVHKKRTRFLFDMSRLALCPEDSYLPFSFLRQREKPRTEKRR